MNNFKLRVVAMPLTALLALAGCEKVDDYASMESDNGARGNKGIDDPWGDDANKCPRNTCGKLHFEPEYLGLIYVKFGDAPAGEEGGTTPGASGDDIRAAHALYDLAICKAVHSNAPAQEVILDYYERKGDWKVDGKCAPISRGIDFKGIEYVGQTDIYVDVDGMQSRIDGDHPVIFTKYSAGNNVAKKRPNFSFYNAKPLPNSTQSGDELLNIQNYYSVRGNGGGLRRLIKPTPPNGPQHSEDYSMNIHLRSGSGNIPIIVDPDTGNGNDG